MYLNVPTAVYLLRDRRGGGGCFHTTIMHCMRLRICGEKLSYGGTNSHECQFREDYFEANVYMRYYMSFILSNRLLGGIAVVRFIRSLSLKLF
jgi:hypothetical protein